MLTWKTTAGTNIVLFKIGITNCFLIEKQDLRVLVDTGQKKFSSKLVALLKSRLKGNDLNYLLLTHTHYDHSQNAKAIFDLFNPKLIVHHTEAECLAMGYTPIPNGTMFITKVIARLGRKFTPQLAAFDKLNADITIDSDYFIENNPELRIIETPGHTKGSVSLIVDNEIAIVGDTMFGHFRKTILTPFGNDIPTMIESWKKLYETNCKLFLPAHGKAIKKEKLEKELKKGKH
jgi:glyoxylase-like metal-dependent hydrolase (beta-lactamase superfamily II)